MQSSFPPKIIVFIVMSFIIALLLSVWPLPAWAWWFKPPWVLVTLIFWVMIMPKQINVGLAFFLGLFVDGLSSGLMGSHALALVIVTFLMVDWKRPMVLLPTWHQALVVMSLVSVYQFILFVLQAMMGMSPWGWYYWLPTLLSLPIWLLLRPVYTYYCRDIVQLSYHQ